jgi:hypothetical protein
MKTAMKSLVLLFAVLTAGWPAVVGPVPIAAGRPPAPGPRDLSGEVMCLDKTWTNGGPRNEAGSQAVDASGLASRVSFKAEGRGFEPPTPFGAPDFE